jgi:hypothetical protein
MPEWILIIILFVGYVVVNAVALTPAGRPDVNGCIV